jgi:uncharacterized membrane protein YhaH (DUF805 family)
MILPYRRYAEFGGRSRRREYWSFVLFYVLVYVVLNVLFGHPETVLRPWGFDTSWGLTGIPALAGGLFGLFNLVPALAVAVRRLHDQDRSGWLLLLLLIPVLGGFALLVLFLLDGTHGPNRYGPDPKHPFDIGAFS